MTWIWDSDVAWMCQNNDGLTVRLSRNEFCASAYAIKMALNGPAMPGNENWKYKAK